VRKHGASTASRRAAPPSARFQRDRPEVGGVTHIVVVYDIWFDYIPVVPLWYTPMPTGAY